MGNSQLGNQRTDGTQPLLPGSRDHEHHAERRRVWVVEDSPLDAEMAKRALGSRYVIEIFADGATMLERLAEGPSPDLLVLDWQLPGMDGLDVCRFIRDTSDDVTLPIVMLTVHGNRQDIVEGLAAGANDYLTKPYDPVELLARVGTLMRTRALYERAKRAERELGIERDRLFQSEGELRTVAEAIPQMVWTANGDGVIEHFNQRWFDYTGSTLDQLRDSGWYSVVHPGDQQRAIACWRSAVESGAVYETQYRIRRADGSYFWFLDRALPLSEQGGRIRKWFGTLTDIHEHKRAEQALDLLARAGVALVASLNSRAAAESTAQLAVPTLADWCGVYLCDDEGVVTGVAQARENGAPAVELLRDLTMGHPLRAGASSSGLKIFQTGEPELIADVEAALHRAEGDQVAHLEKLRRASVTSWMMVPLAVQRRTFGCLAFAIVESCRRYDEADFSLALELGRRTAVAIDNATLFEVTQRDRARIAEANHAKDEFLAAVSHELRTPLTSILGWTVMLRDGSIPEEQRGRAIQTIERNARSQARLIEDLLDVSRIITGNLRLDVGLVRPSESIEMAIETIRPLAGAKGVHLQSAVDPLIGPIWADAERLQQVIWNLLANAVKFTPKGGRVQVSLSRVGEEVEIVVSDNGRGIDPEFLLHVFERFRQADMSLARVHGGLGLGLAITRHLVELHGGMIEARSSGEGLGATFIVRIPVAPPSSTAPPQPSERDSGPMAPSPPRLPNVKGLHVLVAEDDQDARDLLVAMLRNRGVRVTPTASVDEALEAIKKVIPDILVSDVGMPGESGYDLIRKIRLLPPHLGGRIPAVALTAYARTEDSKRALMMGFDLHVSKPVDPSELLVGIVKLAGRVPKT